MKKPFYHELPFRVFDRVAYVARFDDGTLTAGIGRLSVSWCGPIVHVEW